MQIAALYSYPVKGGAPLAHTQMELDGRGPLHDRRWLVIDSADQFLSQRDLPRLALMQPAFQADALTLTAPEMNPLRIPLAWQPGRMRDVTIWKDTCRAWDEGDAAAEWVSRYLGIEARLVRMADDFVRRVDERYAPQLAQTGFSDGFPLLVVSQASLDALNQRLLERGAEAIPMSRFRPNVVINGCDAFAEDEWKTIQANGVLLDVVKPCARCKVTTVDQATATIPDSDEPLATLATFRRWNGKVIFAQNAIHRAPGMLRQGDAVTVIA